MHQHRFHLKVIFTSFLVFIVMSGTLPISAMAATQPVARGVKITPIGSPTWKPVDFHLFSAPIGTAESGYVEFNETMQAVLPPPKHVWIDGLGIGPGAPHQPPYTSELAAGVAAQGYHEGVQFSKSEFSNGMGIYLVFMNVPNPGTTGSSPDFESGPIMANDLFPFAGEGNNYHNGAHFSFLGSITVPPLTNFDFDVDGSSHFPVFWADNADFGPAGARLEGSYTFVTTLVDSTGNGWNIQAHFTVAP